MKKFTLFLSALFISVMSFATEVSFDFSAQGYDNQAEMKSVTLNEDVTVTFDKGTNSNSPKYYGSGTAVRVYGGSYFTVTTTSGKFTKIELTFGSGDKSNAITTDVGNFATNTWTGTESSVKFTVDGTSGHRRIKVIKVTYGEVSADFVAAPTISGDANFVKSTTISMSAAEGAKLYYTVDGTEPTSASTAYTAPFEVTQTTTVKAIAYNGENASEVTSQTFTQATTVTCAEAAELAKQVSGNNVMTEIYYVLTGYVTSVIDDKLSSGQQRFWVADTKDGGQVLQSYYCTVPKVLQVGDKVQMYGQLTKFNSTPQMKNGQVTLLPGDPELKVTSTVLTGTDDLGDTYSYIDFGTVEYGQTSSVTLEFEGKNLPTKYTYYNDDNEEVEGDNYVVFNLSTYPFFDVTLSEGGKVETSTDWFDNPISKYTFPIAADGSVKGSVTMSVKKEFPADPFDATQGYALEADTALAIGSVNFADQTYQNSSEPLTVMITLTKPEEVATPELKITSAVLTGTDDYDDTYSYVDFGTVEYGQTASLTIEFEGKNVPAKYTYYNDDNEAVEGDNCITFGFLGWNSAKFFDVTLSEGGKTETSTDFLGNPMSTYTFPIAADGSVKGSVTLNLKKDFGADPFDEAQGFGLEAGKAVALDHFQFVDKSFVLQSEIVAVMVTLTEPAEGGDDTALEDAVVEGEKAQKVIENGVVYIIKNGVKYTVLGNVVK